MSNLGSCYQNIGRRISRIRETLREPAPGIARRVAIQEEQVKAMPNVAEVLERVGADAL